ncbi:uncharacterized protein CLUP02_06043 [Colletotrichum lupini]|uniref:Uncharacterized protein n=1 Tax=Colletotrichum lupini TaxID=145971 RepID=A0A9Q8SP91_9PEZI|nr:uncharacterized protein CLUP02_06043 [Colletotrichum lupini]UQC80560.1 hypothetical protein CLUP02_06043 [Colletotrichum lupini]
MYQEKRALTGMQAHRIGTSAYWHHNQHQQPQQFTTIRKRRYAGLPETSERGQILFPRTHSLTTPADETFRPWCESGMYVNVNDRGPWGVSVGRNGSPGPWLQLVSSI